jgi:hypothetical protein
MSGLLEDAHAVTSEARGISATLEALKLRCSNTVARFSKELESDGTPALPLPEASGELEELAESASTTKGQCNAALASSDGVHKRAIALTAEAESFSQQISGVIKRLCGTVLSVTEEAKGVSSAVGELVQEFRERQAGACDELVGASSEMREKVNLLEGEFKRVEAQLGRDRRMLDDDKGAAEETDKAVSASKENSRLLLEVEGSLSQVRELVQELEKRQVVVERVLKLKPSEVFTLGHAALVKCLEGVTHLEVFEFGGKLGEAGAEALANALKAGPCPNLATLNLSSNRLGEAGVVALTRALPFCTKLAALNLSSNRLSDAGVVALAEALCGTTSLPSCPNLSALNLRSNGMGEAGKAALAVMKEKLPKLTIIGV